MIIYKKDYKIKNPTYPIGVFATRSSNPGIFSLLIALIYLFYFLGPSTSDSTVVDSKKTARFTRHGDRG
jgi:hypothetical protein